MKKCWNIFLTMFLSILVIYTFIVKENNFIKSGVIIFVTLIIINLYFYKRIVTYFRKSYLEVINLSLYATSMGLLVFSNKNFNKFLIKCKILFNNFSFNNIYYYAIMVSTIFLTILILINLFKDFNKIRKNKNQQNEITLLSFREKEKKKLKEIIKDKKVTSILIEAEMGNGKTTLINSLIKDFENNEGCEIIYFKLPLVKSYEELEKNLLLELQKILVKYDLNNKFINNLLNDVSNLKLGCIEINLGKKESIWNTLQELQKTLMKINKKILIILDDIEREENLEKIYKSILFLGELSEYFRNTNVTILLLSQYDYLELAFTKVLENKKTNSYSQENSVYLDKYYKYRFRLNEPTIYDLNDSDLRLIIENIFKSVSSYGEKSSDENKNKFIASIIENLRNFFDIKNLNLHRSQTKKEIFPKDFQNNIYNIIRTLNLKMNIRLLEKSLQEILYLYTYYEETYIIYSIYIFMILKKNFIKDIEIRFHNSLDKDILNAINLKNTMEFIEKNLLMHYVDSSLKFYSKTDVYSKLSQEIKSIIDTYNKGDVIVEEINITTSKIKEIILGTKNYENDFSLYGYNDYIYNLIKGECLKLNNALENDLIINKTELIRCINSIETTLTFSEISLEKIKNIVLKNELEEKSGECEEDIAYSYYDEYRDILKEEHKEYCKNLKEEGHKFIRKIFKIKEFQEYKEEIINSLKNDINIKIKRSEAESYCQN